MTMGRKSKLSDQQWKDVERRLLDGEKAASIAREYKVSEAAIRQRKTSTVEKIKSVANQIVATERALDALPISSQIAAQTFASKIRSLSDHMLGAATLSAATSHRLHGIAHAEVQKLDDADPLSGDGMETLKTVAALTKIGNEAGVMGTAVISANKEFIRDANQGKEDDPAKFLAELAAHLPN